VRFGLLPHQAGLEQVVVASSLREGGGEGARGGGGGGGGGEDALQAHFDGEEGAGRGGGGIELVEGGGEGGGRGGGREDDLHDFYGDAFLEEGAVELAPGEEFLDLLSSSLESVASIQERLVFIGQIYRHIQIILDHPSLPP